MAVCFPASELTILDYNRVVKDLGCYTSDEFLQALEKDFEVTCMGGSAYKPAQPHEFRFIWMKNGTGCVYFRDV